MINKKLNIKYKKLPDGGKIPNYLKPQEIDDFTPIDVPNIPEATWRYLKESNTNNREWQDVVTEKYIFPYKPQDLPKGSMFRKNRTAPIDDAMYNIGASYSNPNLTDQKGYTGEKLSKDEWEKLVKRGYNLSEYKEGGRAPIKGTKEQYQAYQDSLDLYKQSLQVEPNYFKVPQISKEEYDRLQKKSSSMPNWEFDEEGYKKAKKLGKPIDFKDFMYNTRANTQKDSIAFENNIGKHFKDSQATDTLKDGRIKRYDTEYDGKVDKSSYDIYDPKTGTTRTIMDKELMGISSDKIKPIRTDYFGKDSLIPISSHTLSSTGWHDAKAEAEFKKTDEFKNYMIPMSSNIVYQKPVQPIIYKPEENTSSNYNKQHPPIYLTDSKDPRLNQYTEAGNQYLYKRPKEQPINIQSSKPDLLQGNNQQLEFNPIGFQKGSYFTRPQQGQETGGLEYFDKKTGKKLTINKNMNKYKKGGLIKYTIAGQTQDQGSVPQGGVAQGVDVASGNQFQLGNSSLVSGMNSNVGSSIGNNQTASTTLAPGVDQNIDSPQQQVQQTQEAQALDPQLAQEQKQTNQTQAQIASVFNTNTQVKQNNKQKGMSDVLREEQISNYRSQKAAENFAKGNWQGAALGMGYATLDLFSKSKILTGTIGLARKEKQARKDERASLKRYMRPQGNDNPYATGEVKGYDNATGSAGQEGRNQAFYKYGGKTSKMKTDDKHKKGPHNVEVEGGEYARTPNGAAFAIGGKSHAQGGEPRNFPENTHVYSKELKMKFGKRKMPISKIAAKYNTEKETEDIEDQDLDAISKRTAMINFMLKNEKLNDLFDQQEQAKLTGKFGNSVRNEAIARLSEQHMAKGGLVKYNIAGETNNGYNGPSNFTTTVNKTVDPKELGYDGTGTWHGDLNPSNRWNAMTKYKTLNDYAQAVGYDGEINLNDVPGTNLRIQKFVGQNYPDLVNKYHKQYGMPNAGNPYDAKLGVRWENIASEIENFRNRKPETEIQMNRMEADPMTIQGNFNKIPYTEPIRLSNTKKKNYYTEGLNPDQLLKEGWDLLDSAKKPVPFFEDTGYADAFRSYQKDKYLDIQSQLNADVQSYRTALENLDGGTGVINANSSNVFANKTTADNQVYNTKYNYDNQVDARNNQAISALLVGRGQARFAAKNLFEDRVNTRDDNWHQTIGKALESYGRKKSLNRLENREAVLAQQFAPNYVYDPDKGYYYDTDKKVYFSIDPISNKIQLMNDELNKTKKSKTTETYTKKTDSKGNVSFVQSSKNQDS